MNTLTLKELRATAQSGGIAGVTLKAEGGAFFVKIDTRSGEEAILTKARNSQPRSFGNPLQALTLLRELGLVVGFFNVALWNPDEKAGRTRPDRTEALKRTHGAAEHDRWFREQVQQGVAEADDPNTQWVSHKVVKDDIQKQRKSLQARLALKAK